MHDPGCEQQKHCLRADASTKKTEGPEWLGRGEATGCDAVVVESVAVYSVVRGAAGLL